MDSATRWDVAREALLIVIEARAEIQRLRDIISPGDAAAYEQGMAALQARVGRVLVLHDKSQPVECSPGYFACAHCKYEWPCPTVRILEVKP